MVTKIKLKGLKSMILRNDIKKICSVLGKNYGLDFLLKDCYTIIHEYCKENKMQPSENKYYTENGNLYINDFYVGKIAIITKGINDCDSFWNMFENAIGYYDYD